MQATAEFQGITVSQPFLEVQFRVLTKLNLTTVRCLLASWLALGAGAFESQCGQFPGPAMSAPGELAVESTRQAQPLTRRLHFRQDRKIAGRGQAGEGMPVLP